MTRPRTGSGLISLLQVSVSVNSISDAAPRPARNGNQSRVSVRSGNRQSRTALATSAARISARWPKRAARRGKTEAMTRTPTACIAALRPMVTSPKPRAAKSRAIKGAERP